MILKVKEFIKDCGGYCDIILNFGLFAMCASVMWISIYQLANPV